MESKKRKREADASPPRITFVTPSRTFERLFKETSLEATKATVLKKLGLDAGTTVELSQGRDGRTIDLEDEDDFDALRSYAFSKGGVEVGVTFPGSSKVAEPQRQPEVSALPEEPSARVQKKKKTSRMTASVVAPDAPSIPIGAPDTAAFPEEKDKRKSKTIEASALPSSPTAIPGAPASAALCGNTEAPAKKSKSKRKKTLSVPACQTPPTSAAQVKEPPLEITKKKERPKQVSAILPPEPRDGSIASASPKPNAPDDLSSYVDDQARRLTQNAVRFNLNPSAELPSTAESLVHLQPTSGEPLKEKKKKKKKDGRAKKKLVETDALPAVTAAPLFSTPNQISPPNLEEILKTAGPSQPTAPQAEEEKAKSKKVKASSPSKNKALVSLESIEQPPLAAPATLEVSGVEKPNKKQVEDIQPSATPVVSTTKTSSSDTQKKKRKLPEASSVANPAASVEPAKTKKRKIAEGVGNNVSIVPSGVPVPAGTSSITFAAEVASAIASAGEANTPAKAKKAKKTKAATDGAHTSSDSLQTALDDVIDDVLRKARQRINAAPESSSVSISTEPVSSAVRQFGERPSLATPDVSSHPDTAPQSAQTKTVTGKESKETKANSPPTPKPTPKPSVSLPGTPGTIKRMKDRFGRLASLNIDLSLTQEGTSVNSPVPGEIDGIDESHAEFTPIIKPLRYNTPHSLSVDPSSQGTAVQELSKPTTQQRKEQRPPIVEERERDNSPSIAGRLRRLKQKREVEVVIPLTSLSQVGHRKSTCNPSLVGSTSQPDSDSKIDQMVDIDSSKALDKRTSYTRGMTPDNSEESTARVAAELERKSASTTEVEGSINGDIRADGSPAVSPLPAAEKIPGANLDLVRTASSASPDAGDSAEDSDADKGNVTGKQIHARAPRPSLNTFPGRVGAELERKSASTTEVEGSINNDIRADGSPAVSPLPAAEGILGANLDLVRAASSASSDVGDSAEDSDADKGNVTGKQIHARAPHPSLNTFPSLNDIAARQDLFSPAATPHPSFPPAPVASLASGTRGTGAGTGADDEESSSSGSDSDSDGQFSIPKEKRAGSKLSKPRKAFASLLSYLESRS